MAQDYYETLGISKGASIEDVKKSYKKLAKQYHPDVNTEKSSEEKFKRISEAYKVLSDPEKKTNYDKFGQDFDKFQGFGGAQGFNFEDIFDTFADSGVFGDLFGSAFGGGFGQRGPKRGTDIGIRLSISFEEAAFGTEKKIEIGRTASCNKCQGKGYEKESDTETCKSCNGSGATIQTRRTLLGTIQTRSTCRECGGKGVRISKTCSKCHGDGIINETLKKTIEIPGGIDSGQHLRIRNSGNAGGLGAPPGDLLILIYVEPHTIFKRDGSDIYCEIPIGFAEAALGTKIKVPTLKGEATLVIPQGTQTHTIFKLNGKGIKRLQGFGKGDQYIKVIVSVPKKLSKKQKELLQKLKEEDSK